MEKFNIKEQIRSQYFWASIISLILLTAQEFGLNFLPTGFENYCNSVLVILVGMGILNNNQTNGLGK